MTLKCEWKHTKSFVDMSTGTGQSHMLKWIGKVQKATNIYGELLATKEYWEEKWSSTE